LLNDFNIVIDELKKNQKSFKEKVSQIKMENE